MSHGGIHMPENDQSEFATPQEPKAQDERTVIDAVADLLQVVVDFLRQEVDRIMRTKIVVPLQRLGFTLFAASAAASLMALGLGFISVGGFMHLGQLIGYANALLVIGGVLALASAIFTAIKLRLMQK